MNKFLGLFIAVMLLISCCGCGKNTADGSAANNSGLSVTENSAVSESTVNSEEIVSEEPQDALLQIQTNYGIIYYPQEWESLLKTEEVETDGTDTVTFSAVINGNEYNLFQVFINDEEGDSVGKITDQNGNSHNVFVNINDLGELADIDEASQNQIYAMQEAVNVLIEKLD